MLARLRYRVAELAVADARGDEGTAIARPDGFERDDIGALAHAERDDTLRIGSRGVGQTIAVRAVEWDDRGAARLESLEDFALGVGDRGFVGEERGVRGRYRRHDRDVRADERGQMREFAGMVPSHLEHAIIGPGRHPREAERYAGMVVVALDRTVRATCGRAIERGEQRFLGSGLSRRSGHADDS